MKRIIVVLVLLFAGWEAAVFLLKKTESTETTSLIVTDSVQAKADVPDTISQHRASDSIAKDTVVNLPVQSTAQTIQTGNVHPQELVSFAKTQIGIPYLYGSTDPNKGFDCSGFITYVFNHFGIAVPRSSIDFTNVGTEVKPEQAKQGDLILFTGTDSTERFVGHMGIVTENTDSLRFIHSSSGKANGVTITPLNDYYRSRYVKTIRVFQ